MGYIDKQVAQYQKSLDAASSGATLRNAIRKLQEKSQIRDSLKPLRKRGDLVSPPGRGTRVGSAAGMLSPFTEVANTRQYHTSTQELTSADGLFVIEYKNTRQVTMKDFGNNEVIFIYDDYIPT